MVIGFATAIIQPNSHSIMYGFDKPATNVLYQNQQCSIAFKAGDWTDLCKINKFNPQDGILKNIKITMQASTKSEVKLENLNIIPVQFNVSSVVDVVIVDENKNELITNQVKAAKNYSLDKYDGITDYTGKSGTIDANLASLVSERTNVFGDSARMSGFVKNDINDTITKSIVVKSQGSVSSTNNMDSKITTQTEVNLIKIQYEYLVGDVSVSKFHEPSIFEKGKVGQVKLKVTNFDTEPTEGNITVVDELPSFLLYVSQDNADWTCTNTMNLECKTQKTLASKESSYVVINVKVLDSAPNSYINTATVSYNNKEYNYDNNTSKDLIVFGIAPQVPQSYDCNLGITNINTSFMISSVNKNCIIGTDLDGDITVVKYSIKSLPDTNVGKLQYDNNDIPVDFIVTQGNQNRLVFVPNDDSCGKYSFTYAAIDETNLQDLTPAVVSGEVKCNTLSKAPSINPVVAILEPTLTTAVQTPQPTVDNAEEEEEEEEAPTPTVSTTETAGETTPVKTTVTNNSPSKSNAPNDLIKKVSMLTRTGALPVATILSLSIVMVLVSVLIFRKYKTTK